MKNMKKQLPKIVLLLFCCTFFCFCKKTEEPEIVKNNTNPPKDTTKIVDTTHQVVHTLQIPTPISPSNDSLVDCEGVVLRFKPYINTVLAATIPQFYPIRLTTQIEIKRLFKKIICYLCNSI
jgi:hypothetical protein